MIGLADPAPLILALYMDGLCKSRLRLDGVLAVVDSVNLKFHLELEECSRGQARGAVAHPVGTSVHSDKSSTAAKEENEVIKQIAYADRIVLNKVDLLSAAAISNADAGIDVKNPEAVLEEVKRTIATINPGVGIFPCTRGNVSISELLNINAFDARKSGELLLSAEFCQPISISRLNSKKSDNKVTKSGTPSVNNFNTKRRDSNPAGLANVLRVPSVSRKAVQTCSLIAKSPLNLDAVNVWLLSLLQSSGEDIYRVKGILDVAGYPEQFVVQGVHMMFDGCRGREWRENEIRKSVLVFIGVKLDEFQLQHEFEACTEKSLEKNKAKT